MVELDNGAKYDVIWSGYKQKKQAGAALVFKHDPNIHIEDIEYISSRIVAVYATIFGFKLKLISCYSPTDCSKDSQKALFHTDLNKATNLDSRKRKLVCLGDFNATLGPTICRNRATRFNYTTFTPHDSNDNGNKLINFVRKHSLNISNTFFSHRKIHRHTWRSGTGFTKTIDYILADSSVQKYMTDCRVYNGYHFETDHRLSAAVTTPTCKAARFKANSNPKKPNPRPNLRLLQDPVIRSKFTELVSQKITTSLPASNMNDMAKNLRTILNDAASSAIPSQPKSKKQTNIRASDKELNDLLAEREKLNKNQGIQVKKLTKKIKKRRSQLRNQLLEQEANEINQHAISRDIEKLFSTAKKDTTTFKKPRIAACPQKSTWNISKTTLRTPPHLT